MSERELVIEEYRFTLKQSRDRIFCFVRTIDGSDIDDHRDRIETIFKDMGKWETIVSAGADFLEAIGILAIQNPIVLPYGFNRYKIEFSEAKDDHAGWYIGFTSVERHLRSGGVSLAGTTLSVKEIANQIENTPKWRNLEKALGHLGALRRA